MTGVLTFSLTKIIAVNFKHQVKHINAICEQSAEIFNVKAVTNVLKE